jgi:site-specific DNA-cytosine methylase
MFDSGVVFTRNIVDSVATALQHTAIDIIIGGPPCQDFSRVNARRQGIRGKNAIFLTRTMNIIKSIQNHPKQGGRPVFAMVENVAFTEFTDIQVTEEAFECAPVELDAQYFSPCRRNRHYWVNVSVWYRLILVCVRY